MGGAIGPDNSSPIKHKRDRQVLDAHVVDELVEGPLQKGAVNGHHGFQTLTGHAGGHGDGVLFGDAHIEILVGAGFFKQVEARARGHRGRNPNHGGVLLAEFDQGLAEDLAVARGLGLTRGVGLARGQIKGRLGVVAHLVGLGIGVALALGGSHMDQDRTFGPVGLLEGAHHLGDVVAIDGADVGEAQLLEHGAHLGNAQALHAFFEVFELGRQLAMQEGQMFDRFFRIALQELNRRA